MISAAGKPFCEKLKKWRREFNLYFPLPENTTTMLQKLIANEDSVIQGVMSMTLPVLVYTQLEGRFGGRVPMVVVYFYGGCVIFDWLIKEG